MVCRGCPEGRTCHIKNIKVYDHCECGEIYNRVYIKNHERGPYHKNYILNKTTIDQHRASYLVAFKKV